MLGVDGVVVVSFFGLIRGSSEARQALQARHGLWALPGADEMGWGWEWLHTGEGEEGEAAEVPAGAGAGSCKRRAHDTEPLTAQQLALLLELGEPLNYPLGKGTRTPNGGWTGLGKWAEFLFQLCVCVEEVTFLRIR